MACMKRFWADRNGNFAMMFGILAVPLLIGGGLAVDYINLSRQKSSIQEALDAAALAVTREGPKNLTQEQALEIAKQFVAANYPELALQVKARIISDDTVEISGETDYPTSFGGVFGAPMVDVAAVSRATYSAIKYEIVFVLDTTGSMAGGKLMALQAAVTGMIDDIAKENLPAGTIKYGVVPYAGFVNVGSQYGPVINNIGLVTKRGASWLDVDARAPITQSDLPQGMSRFALFHHLGQDWKGCVETRQASAKGNHDTEDTPPVASDPSSLFTPMFAIDEPDNRGDWPYPNSYLGDNRNPVVPGNTNNGDKINRLKRYGRMAAYTYPSTLETSLLEVQTWRGVSMDNSPSQLYSNEADPKGPNYGCEIEPIQPLTDNANKVKKMVNQLYANGSTNTLTGVTWGWRVLSPGEPFTEGQPKSAKDVVKTMIFLTDGANSFGVLPNSLKSGYTSLGYLVDGRLNGATSGTNETLGTALDAKTLTACSNIKNDGIEIFTIRLEEPDVQTGEMLKKCATGPLNFFDAPSRTQLDSIFKSIKKEIMRVRLTS